MWMYFYLKWCTRNCWRCVTFHYRQSPLRCVDTSTLMLCVYKFKHYLHTELEEEAAPAKSDCACCLTHNELESIYFADFLVVVLRSLFGLWNSLSYRSHNFWRCSWKGSVGTGFVPAQVVTVSEDRWSKSTWFTFFQWKWALLALALKVHRLPLKIVSVRH